MDWFLYDRACSHERVEVKLCFWFLKYSQNNVLETKNENHSKNLQASPGRFPFQKGNLWKILALNPEAEPREKKQIFYF